MHPMSHLHAQWPSLVSLPLLLGSSTPISLVQSHLPEHPTAGMMAALSLYSSPMTEGNEVLTIHAGFEEESDVKFTSGNTVGK